MNKCRCKQDAALYSCCNIEYNHGKSFTMVAKPMKNWELQSLQFAIFSCVNWGYWVLYYHVVKNA